MKNEKMSSCTDLFEILQNSVCCTYISDLKMAPYKAKAQLVLAQLELGSFPARQVQDVFAYLGVSC